MFVLPGFSAYKESCLKGNVKKQERDVCYGLGSGILPENYKIFNDSIKCVLPRITQYITHFCKHIIGVNYKQ